MYFSGVIQATEAGVGSWNRLSAGTRQLRKVSKNVGAMQSEDSDRHTLLLLSEELRHYCKGVFGSSCRLVLFCFSAAWMKTTIEREPGKISTINPVSLAVYASWTLGFYYSDQTLSQMSDCLTVWLCEWASEPAWVIEPGSSAHRAGSVWWPGSRQIWL